jgi:cysteine desulfurase/selenocysteine lyase
MLQGVRADFPGLERPVHGRPLVYLDNAASSQMPRQVMQAMQEFELDRRANIHRGVHARSQQATDAHEAARATLAAYLGADATHELVFGSGTTDALNQVAFGLSDDTDGQPWLRPGDEIIVTALEHHANLLPWRRAARRSGARLRVLMPQRDGTLATAALAELLGPRTRVLALTACANATGYRPPYEAMMALAHQAGALTVLDAAQAAAHEMAPLRVLGCDFLALSGHKMHGPMGIGVLAGRREALERLTPLRVGGDMVEQVGLDDVRWAPLPARLEGGTPNVAGAVGLAAAAGYLQAHGRAALDAHVAALRAQAVAGLTALPGVRVLEGGGAIVAFVAEGAHPHDIGTVLDGAGVAVRTGFHCAQPLHDHLGLGPTTRASFALYNTADDVAALVEGVAQALEMLR